MDEGNVESPQEPIEQIVETAIAEQDQPVETVDQASKPEKTMIPLSVAQKLREQKRELELELQWERQRNAQAQQASHKPIEEDNSRYESATKEDLSTSQNEAIRIIEERLWIKQNPEKYEKINEYLPQFLKQRPNLASAINSASNRYEEAFTLMDALTPKQQQQLVKAAPVKKEAPGAPTNAPKAAALNQSVDVMTMSDSEFDAWRNSQRRRR